MRPELSRSVYLDRAGNLIQYCTNSTDEIPNVIDTHIVSVSAEVFEHFIYACKLNRLGKRQLVELANDFIELI